MASRTDSLDIVLAYAREEYEQQRSAHERIVARAAGFLGFVTALIGLAGLGVAHGDPERWILIAGVAALIIAALLLVRINWLREYLRAPLASTLNERYREKPEQETKQAILSITVAVIEKNDVQLRKVRGLYQIAVTLVAVGAGCVGSAVIAAAL